MKPLIHMFKTENNYYFYDVNRNENVHIDEEVYHSLDKILNGEIDEISIDEKFKMQFDELRREGYLSTNRIREIKHPATDLLDTYLSRKMKMITIQLTQNCNLRCEYCPYTENNGTERKHSNKKIDFETIKKALLIFRDNSIDNDNVSVTFYGGEPLLEFDLIRKTVDYCKELFSGKHVKFSLTTNATLFTKEIMEFFEKEKFNLLISLDGPKHLNDKNRKFYNSNKSVFDKVVKNIQVMKDSYKSLFNNLSLNMVIDPTTDLNDYLSLFRENKILDDVRVRTTILDDYTEDNRFKSLDSFVEQYCELENKYSSHIFENKELTDERFIESLFFRKTQDLLEDIEKTNSLGNVGCPSGPCVPGAQRLFVDVDGKFYPCERVSESNKFNIIGNVNEGIMIEEAEKILNIAKYNSEKCKNCFAFRECGFCINSYEKELDKVKVSNQMCESRRNTFHKKLINLQTIKEKKYNKSFRG
ncbi:radical SAM/SPASM domain-containing protein [Sporosalibacterium faouarense]|uniref:radical SAM/SPASM domain-containing protein n=1 Tax=Sporosalibacterium faouarense TaxID=516123 RepID=UPI00192BC18A|nr:radical SAM protein [Sporosalibacterium faouarense]